jgi:hypothetical protein
MKRALFILCLTLILGLPNLQPLLGKDAPTSAPQLVTEVEAAIKAKDKAALLALVNWQGVSADMKSFQTELLSDLLRKAVQGVKLLPLPADFQPPYVLDEVRYIPNVAILGLIEVEFANAGNALRMPYGKNGETFCLAGTAQEKTAPTRKETTINIMILGDASADAAAFTGSYVYVHAGKEVTSPIKGKGPGTEAFWGEYVKSCTVQKTSDSGGAIKLVILEGGKKVYQSEEVTTTVPIAYEKK